MAKKKKMKDKRRIHIKKRRKAERLAEKNRLITFLCPNCKVREDIPKDVVDTFDVVDDGDLSMPPRFRCEVCGDDMEPIEYTSVHGITYKIDEKSLG